MACEHTYLRRDLREFLATDRAHVLAEGADCRYEEYDILHDLDLTWERLTTGPLDVRSRRRLARLIADPMQPVCVDPSDDPPCACGRVHVDFAAVAREGVLARIDWYHLPEAVAREWEGPHHHGRITILRDAAGVEHARWDDGDPTKGGAWDIWREVPLDEAWRLLGLTRVSMESA